MKKSVFAVAAAALIVSVLPARAQDVISYGQTITGYLSETDYQDSTVPDLYNDVYSFVSQAGDVVEVRMNSDDFDTYLGVGSVEEVNGIEIEDDDSGGNLNAYIRFTAPISGEYFIFATSASEFETGSYTLSLARANGVPAVSNVNPAPSNPAPAQNARQTAISPGQTMSGTIATNDPQIDGKYYDAYVFKGGAGQSVTITMTSTDMDAYLMLYRADNLNNAIATDDDSGGSLNARLSLALPAGTTYVIYATTAYTSSTGAYQIAINGNGGAPAPAPVSGGGGSTVVDGIDFGRDTSEWANDGECDDPRFQGTGVASYNIPADIRADATDCLNAYRAGTARLQ